ncbi:hypothetical protein LCGC14_0483220 [marine sediment metagenome]|uniref:Flp pilus assembly protein, pilin Flp n=1 Tax=marine sediment metagenome TaxID=412755 RepID=A0A0F9VHN8_9ZZZZ|tara:strand:+ start:2180 stop:2353 length:174 start_codon:yes stop_codon:yes gene_type:complete
MFLRLKKLWRREEGAVTVDWVVLSAAIVLLAALIISSMTTGTVDLADSLMTQTPGAF